MGGGGGRGYYSQAVPDLYLIGTYIQQEKNKKKNKKNKGILYPWLMITNKYP